jgi:hypothetical protein
MRVLITFVGFGVLAYAFFDVLHTTLVLQGAGPVTSRLSRATWRMVLRVGRIRRSHRILSFVGVFIIVEVLVTWICLVWLGWFLVFLGGDPSVVEADARSPAGFWDLAYYTGYTISTLGVGDFIPTATPWQIFTAVASGSGFVLFSLSISYVVPIVSAAAQTRQLAEYVAALGRTGPEVLVNGWNGRDFLALEPHLIALTPMVALLSQHYLAYPVLHYFHSPDPDSATPVSLAALDEALTLLDVGVADEARPPKIDLLPLRKSLSVLLEHLNVGYVRAGELPPLPARDELAGWGIPLSSEEDYSRDMHWFDGRRRVLQAWLVNDGWSWELLERPIKILTPSGIRRAH